MRVQRVLESSGAQSWTVIGPDLRVVEPVERYLAWLSRIERAPTTVRAYAHDLKTYWSFLAGHAIAWDAVTLEQLGRFTAWLRQPAENVVVLASGTPRRSTVTVNRMLTAVFGFYEFHARHGVPVGVSWVTAPKRRALQLLIRVRGGLVVGYLDGDGLVWATPGLPTDASATAATASTFARRP